MDFYFQNIAQYRGGNCNYNRCVSLFARFFSFLMQIRCMVHFRMQAILEYSMDDVVSTFYHDDDDEFCVDY